MEQSAYITCMPDFGVIIPPDDMLHTTLRERAEAACNTIYGLVENGLDPEFLAPTEEDTAIVADLVSSFAKDEEATNKAATSVRMSALRPAVILQIDDALTEFSHSVVKNAVQIRHFVTNKLLLESSNPDPRVRIRALELLGKISDVGLFTERSEVTVTHRSTEDLKQSLRDKLDALRAKSQARSENVEQVEDAVILTPVEIEGPLVGDLDMELGIDTASMLAEVVGRD
jgi:hypothetical protein